MPGIRIGSGPETSGTGLFTLDGAYGVALTGDMLQQRAVSDGHGAALEVGPRGTPEPDQVPARVSAYFTDPRDNVDSFARVEVGALAAEARLQSVAQGNEIIRPLTIGLQDDGVYEDHVRLAAGSTVLNEAGADIDTRIEGDTDPNAFVVDASVDRVGVGLAPGSIAEKFHVGGIIRADQTVKVRGGGAFDGIFTVSGLTAARTYTGPDKTGIIGILPIGPADLGPISTDRLLGRDTGGSGPVEELTVSGGLEFTGALGIQRSALTGDVTASAGSNATVIANDAVTFAKMQNIATDRLLGRDTAGTGDVEEISLNADLEFTGAGAIRTAAFSGDVSKSAGGTVVTIQTDAVTFAKFQNISTDRLLGRDTPAGGDIEEITVGGGLEFTGAVGIQRSALTGDVTASAGSNATTIAADAVSNTKLANMIAWTIKVRNAGSTGDPSDAALADITVEGSPTTGDFLVLFKSTGEIRVVNWSTLPGAGGGAPTTAEYLVGALDGTLSAERLVTDTATVTWDLSVAGQAKSNVPNDAITYAKIQNIATDSLIGRDTAGTGDPETILLNATLEMDGSGNLRRAALSGDITASTGSNVTAIGLNKVLDTMLRDSAALSVIGRAANSIGDPGDIAAAADDRILRRVSSAIDFGQLTVGMAPASLWTYAKIQDVSATDRLLGRDTAGAGVIEELSVSGGLEFTGSGGIQRSALTGDVTATAGSNATTIANDAVSNTKLANMVAWTIKVRNASSTGDPSDAALADITTEGSPASGMFAIGFLSTGELRKFDLGLFPVPAHNLLSASHGDTVVQTVSRGSIIYGNSTPKWDELVLGANHRFLKSDGTDLAYAQVDVSSTDITGTLAIANGGTGQTTATLAFNALDPLTTKGDVIIHNGTDSVRQAVGADRTLLIALASAATGWENRKLQQADMSYIGSRGHSWVDHFEAGTANGETGWTGANVGAGATETINTLALVDANHPGVVEFTTGTTATGQASLHKGTATIRLGGGPIIIEMLVQVAALSTVAQEYDVYFGLTNAASAPGNGVYFIYDRNTSLNWKFVTVANSTATTTDTGIAVAAGAWVKLRIEINAAATSIGFFVNGTSGGAAHTTNIPTVAGRETGPRLTILKSAGTTPVLMYVDYYGMEHEFTTAS